MITVPFDMFKIDSSTMLNAVNNEGVNCMRKISKCSVLAWITEVCVNVDRNKGVRENANVALRSNCAYPEQSVDDACEF